MKPILAQKAPRLTDDRGQLIAEPIKEWAVAESHLTHDGTVAFMARMKQRIAAASKVQSNVTKIKRAK